MSRAIERRGRWQPPKFIDEELDEDRLREALVAQHERLRAMLGILDARALEVIRGATHAQAELAKAFADIVGALDDHMRGEERAFAKLLPRTPAAGRALALLHEAHRCQREELSAVSQLAARCDDGITLALAVRGLVSDMRLDMDAEDLRYLSGRPLEGELSDAED